MGEYVSFATSMNFVIRGQVEKSLEIYLVVAASQVPNNKIPQLAY